MSTPQRMPNTEKGYWTRGISIYSDVRRNQKGTSSLMIEWYTSMEFVRDSVSYLSIRSKACLNSFQILKSHLRLRQRIPTPLDPRQHRRSLLLVLLKRPSSTFPPPSPALRPP